MLKQPFVKYSNHEIDNVPYLSSLPSEIICFVTIIALIIIDLGISWLNVIYKLEEKVAQKDCCVTCLTTFGNIRPRGSFVYLIFLLSIPVFSRRQIRLYYKWSFHWLKRLIFSNKDNCANWQFQLWKKMHR